MTWIYTRITGTSILAHFTNPKYFVLPNFIHTKARFKNGSLFYTFHMKIHFANLCSPVRKTRYCRSRHKHVDGVSHCFGAIFIHDCLVGTFYQGEGMCTVSFNENVEKISCFCVKLLEKWPVGFDRNLNYFAYNGVYASYTQYTSKFSEQEK